MYNFNPPCRPLRIYAFNPAVNLSLLQAVRNELILNIPWEEALRPGPVGEYVEVVDFDPESGVFYSPVDLNTPALLVQQGLPPAEGLPQFHQQMVYALVMSIIQSYERALGRTILWAPYVVNDDPGAEAIHFVQRLRVYPHAIRTQQTHYSPVKKALLVGYSQVDLIASDGQPAQAVSFGCLSFGMVAHETTHAILHGLGWNVGLKECGLDELAVQEALADLTGLLEQLAVPGFIRQHVALSSDLEANLRALADMARRLAQPGNHGQLRKYIGATGQPSIPVRPGVPSFLERAALLVAAVCDACMTVWQIRCERLLALGHPDSSRQQPSGEMLAALAEEAARCSARLLQICIRAVDYCPPVDVTVGDFLRAAITADTDLFPQDECGFRIALVEAFRRLRLYPIGAKSLSPLQLLWPSPRSAITLQQVASLRWGPATTREEEFHLERSLGAELYSSWLLGGNDALAVESAREMGLALDADAPRTIERELNGLPKVTVVACRLARRGGHNGRSLADWVIKITQARRGYFDESTQEGQDRGEDEIPADFTLRGGCTLLVDSITGRVRHCVAKDLLSADRLTQSRQSERQRISVLTTLGSGEQAARLAEPFFLLRGTLTDLPVAD